MTARDTATAAAPDSAPKRAPLRWELPVWVIVNCTLAAIPVVALGHTDLLLYSLVPALLLTVILLLVPSQKAARVGLVVAVLLLAASILSVLTAQNPVLAIGSMVAVLYLSSLSARPIGMFLGTFWALAYLAYTWLGAEVILNASVSKITIVGLSAASSAITIVAMLLTWRLFSKVTPEAAEEIEHQREKSGLDLPEPGKVARVLGPSNPMFRYALVRAASFGIVMALAFSARGESGAFWILLAMLIVGRPTGPAAWKSAAQRIVGTLAGVLIFLVAYTALPEPAMLALTAAILLIGLAWIERSATFVLACATVFVIAISGVAQADYVNWAWARLIDTAIGSVIGAGVSMLGESPARLEPSDDQGAADSR